MACSSMSCWIQPSFNPLMPVVVNIDWHIQWYLSHKSDLRKVFEVEMFNRYISTTLLQIFCECMRNFLSYFEKYHRILQDLESVVQSLVDWQEKKLKVNLCQPFHHHQHHPHHSHRHHHHRHDYHHCNHHHHHHQHYLKSLYFHHHHQLNHHHLHHHHYHQLNDHHHYHHYHHHHHHHHHYHHHHLNHSYWMPGFGNSSLSIMLQYVLRYHLDIRNNSMQSW